MVFLRRPQTTFDYLKTPTYTHMRAHTCTHAGDTASSWGSGERSEDWRHQSEQTDVRNIQDYQSGKVRRATHHPPQHSQLRSAKWIIKNIKCVGQPLQGWLTEPCARGEAAREWGLMERRLSGSGGGYGSYTSLFSHHQCTRINNLELAATESMFHFKIQLRLKGIVHPKLKISPICYSSFCCDIFKIHMTILEFHRGMKSHRW